MNKKFSQEFSTNSNSSAVNKSNAAHNPSPSAGSSAKSVPPFGGDANHNGPKVEAPIINSDDPMTRFFTPIPSLGPADDHPCIFLREVHEMKAGYSVEEGESEIMFGAKALSPSFVGPLTSPTMSFDMKLQLLALWDRCDAATLMMMGAMRGFSPMKHFRIKDPSEVLDKRLRTFISTAKRFLAEINKDHGGDVPTEEELVDAYEKWQYEQRKALGEPVLFRDGRLCFEAVIFENGLQPGPFPGLESYSWNGELVDPKELAQWLADTKVQRKEQRNEYVGFFGCKTCPVHAADMVWFFGTRYDIHGPESYRTFLKLNGKPPILLSITSTLLQSLRSSNEPLPCMAQD